MVFLLVPRDGRPCGRGGVCRQLGWYLANLLRVFSLKGATRFLCSGKFETFCPPGGFVGLEVGQLAPLWGCTDLVAGEDWSL